MPIKKRVDKESFETCDTTSASNQITPALTQDLIDAGIPVRTMQGGTGGTPPVQPTVQRNASSGEKVIYFGDAAIVLGPQRNTNEMSGEGKSGFPSDTIDIVVGFNSGGQSCNGLIVNVNAVTDVARVYVSRSVKVDKMFGIARKLDPVIEKPDSAVVMKAGSIRIISRGGGIKLVTGRQQGAKGAGRMGERSSRRGDYQQAPTIDLIAGNNIGTHEVPFPEMMKPFINVIKKLIPWYEPKYSYLQPAIMGDNMTIALRELSDMVSSTASAVMTTNLVIMTVFQSMATALAVPAPPVAAALTTAAKYVADYGVGTEWSIQQQMASWEYNFLDFEATRYICSKNVNIT